jgi:pyruvate,water dikinase
MNYFLRFEEITLRHVALVGGKGASLGELHRQRIPVPSGFVVTTDAHRLYLETGHVPEGLSERLRAMADALDAVHFAVRSSATVEDSATASWAGQFESYLYVTHDRLLEALQDCWHSASSERVEAYRLRQGLGTEPISLAVVVQRMIPSVISGTCFTRHPVLPLPDEMVIEAVRGLGQALVDGSTTPDHYRVRKTDLGIVQKIVSEQDGDSTQKLTDAQIGVLAEIALRIEKHYGTPQDIEWAFDGSDFHIVQARPITS